MAELNESDLEKIKFIIDRLAKDQGLTTENDLQIAGIYKDDMSQELVKKDFERIAKIIKNHDLAKVLTDGGYLRIIANDNTDEVSKIGVLEFIEKRKKEINAAKTNNTVNLYGDNKGNIIHSSSISKSPLTTKVTANTNPQIQKNFIIKFWKLISKNPLVSGIILAIILYLIKTICNIEL